MAWLNYHHLYYFWTIAKEGSVAAASRKLRLAQPTLSGQLKALEGALATELFHRRGGKLVLTETGAHVLRYAEEIFSLGRELQDSLSGAATKPHRRLIVGAADEVPKVIVQRLLQPALERVPDLRLVCYEDRQDRLLADLAVRSIDAVLAEAPVEAGSPVRAYAHPLGECGVTLFAAPELAARLRRGFPRSLEGAPLLVLIENTQMRRTLDRWLEQRSIRPAIRGEFQDYALLGAFGRAGMGAFAAPSVMSDEIREHYGVSPIAELEGLQQSFYVITIDKRIEHPGITAIVDGARTELFAD